MRWLKSGVYRSDVFLPAELPKRSVSDTNCEPGRMMSIGRAAEVFQAN
jgi:hypothetical protein